jgi:DNA-binding Lrp family transcriptional regulator
VRLAEVLAGVEGLTKRFVYYLEAQGHIRPKRLEKKRIARRDYSEEDLGRIRAIWSYYRRGFSVQNAVDLAEQADRALAYVLFAVPARRWEETLELLRGFENVLEASVVYGESEDVIAKLSAPDDGDIFAVLGAALRQASVAGQPTILKIARHAIDRAAAGGGGVQAYVLVKASAKSIEVVLEELRRLDGVVEASVVYGESDVICRIDVPDQDRLDRLVMRDIHAIPAVESTRTFIVVGSMHWRR